MSHAKDDLAAIQARLGAYHRADRSTMSAFKGIADAATREGALRPALKELTALSIAVAKGCGDCIVYHAGSAHKLGATREELVEMLSVAVEMAGGPGVVYAAKALQAFDELAA